MRDVAIIGVGMNKWGELWKSSLRDLAVEAGLKAVSDAGVDHIDSIVVGCMSSGLFTAQEHIAPLVAEYLGQGSVPATRVESACASGGLAFRTGFAEVASGLSDRVLVIGVEKMTDVSADEATFALGTAADQEYESYNGATFPGLYAMMANRHMHEFKTTRRQLSWVAVKNHKHGMKNPNAQYRSEVTVEEVENATQVADPLRLLDCSPITDGAAAILLCPLDTAKKKAKGHPLVKALGIGQATDTLALHSRRSLCELPAVAEAGARAYKAAGRRPADISCAEVHDCFTIAEVMVAEALGFAPKGKGGRLAESGASALGGKTPINTSGGLKSKGHPVGATGVAQIVELTEQLRGEAGPRQVKGARTGLAQNMGGTGASCVVSILGAV